MADEQIKIEITLDDGSIKTVMGTIQREAKKTGDTLEGALKKDFLGEIKGGFDDLVKAIPGANRFANAIALIPPQLKIAGAAIAAFGIVAKEIFDQTLEGEKINAVNKSFEVLSKNAGIAGASLAESFTNSGQGLIQTDEIMAVLNKSIVQFGNNAQNLGGVFELAVKASQVFGGSVQQNFQNLSDGIANLSSRQLKQLGIVVDTDKVFKEYAKSIGVVASQLSISEKQQALMNAVMERGKEAFAGVGTDVLQATNAYTRFKNAVSDIIQFVQSKIADTFGPMVAKVFNFMSEALDGFITKLNASSGKGIESLNAKIKIASDEVTRLGENIKSATNGADLSFEQVQKLLPGLAKGYSDARLQLSLLMEEKRKLNAIDSQSAAQTKAEEALRAESERQAAQLEALKTYNSTVLNMQKEQIQAQLEAGASGDLLKSLQQEQEFLRAVEFAAQMQALEDQARAAGLLNTQIYLEQRNALIDQYNKQAEERQVQQAAGFVGRMKITSAQVQTALQTTLASSIKYMANQLAQGKLNFEDFAKHLLGTLGDAAIQIGAMAIASGIAMESIGNLTGTKAAIAGAALIGIGIIMKALAGGGGGASSASSAPVPSFGTDQSSLPSQNQPDIEQVKPATNVSVNIQGNVLDRRETGLEIAKIIQESFDSNGSLITTGAIA